MAGNKNIFDSHEKLKESSEEKESTKSIITQYSIDNRIMIQVKCLHQNRALSVANVV